MLTFFVILFIITWIYQGYVFQDLAFRWPELIIGLVGFAILGKLKTVIQNQKKIFKALDIPVEEPETPEADKKNAEEPPSFLFPEKKPEPTLPPLSPDPAAEQPDEQEDNKPEQP